MSNPKRYLKEIREALRGVNSIMDDLDESTIDLAQIKAAAMQCQQATSTLYRLVGVMESELYKPSETADRILSGPEKLTAILTERVNADIKNKAVTYGQFIKNVGKS